LGPLLLRSLTTPLLLLLLLRRRPLLLLSPRLCLLLLLQLNRECQIRIDARTTAAAASCGIRHASTGTLPNTLTSRCHAWSRRVGICPMQRRRLVRAMHATLVVRVLLRHNGVTMRPSRRDHARRFRNCGRIRLRQPV
jgi:hypothetical protein